MDDLLTRAARDNPLVARGIRAATHLVRPLLAPVVRTNATQVTFRRFGNTFRMPISDFRRAAAARGGLFVCTHDYEHLDFAPAEAVCAAMPATTNYGVAHDAWWNRAYVAAFAGDNVVPLYDRGRVERVRDILNAEGNGANVWMFKYRHNRQGGLGLIARGLDGRVPILGVRVTSASAPPLHHRNASRLDILTRYQGHTFDVALVDLDREGLAGSDGDVPGLYVDVSPITRKSALPGTS